MTPVVIRLRRLAALLALIVITLPGAACSHPATVKPGRDDMCAADTLKITRLGGDAGMGHRTLAFAFTNTSATPCRLEGYAEVTPLDANGQPVNAINLTRANGDYLNPRRQVHTLDLAPGQMAWFETGYSVIPHGNAACPSVQQLQVRAPGTASGRRFEQPMAPCDGIEVLPLQDGPAPY